MTWPMVCAKREDYNCKEDMAPVTDRRHRPYWLRDFDDEMRAHPRVNEYEKDGNAVRWCSVASIIRIRTAHKDATMAHTFAKQVAELS